MTDFDQLKRAIDQIRTPPNICGFISDEADKRELALVESHRLLKHYSCLLNGCDNGKRWIPNDLEDWVKVINDRHDEQP